MRNSGGFVRVVFPAWGLDIGWYDLIAVGHWIGNVTAGGTSAITAKGGTEYQGFWFDTAEVWGVSVWANGDRCSPIRQAALFQHANFALAIAAMANNDFLLAWYINVANRRDWDTFVGFANVAGSVWGMLSRRQIGLHNQFNTIHYSGNLLGQNVQAIAANLRLTGQSTPFYYNPAVGQAGAGVRLTRSFLMDVSGYTFLVGANATAGTCQVDNCFFWNCANRAIASTPGILVYFCTVMQCVTGINIVAATVVRNCLAVDCTTAGFAGAGLAAIRNCASTDATPPVDPTNLGNQTYAQIALFYDLAGPGNLVFPPHGCIHNDSVCRGAGTPIAGLDRDIDYRLRDPVNPSIGCCEGHPVAFAPAADLIRGHLLRSVV